MRMSLPLKLSISTNETLSPSILPSDNGVSCFWSLISEFALPVSLSPSCLRVKVYFCRPIWESNSDFHVPERSAVKAMEGRARRTERRSWFFIVLSEIRQGEHIENPKRSRQQGLSAAGLRHSRGPI